MKNLLAVQGQIKSGELRVTDVAEEHISLIKEKNPAINAIIHFDEEKVRAEAGIIQNKVDAGTAGPDRKSTRLNSSHVANSYAVFCLKKKKTLEKCTIMQRR